MIDKLERLQSLVDVVSISMVATAVLAAIVAANWRRAIFPAARVERVVACKTHFLLHEEVVRATVVLSSRALTQAFPFVARVESTADCRRVFSHGWFVDRFLMSGWHVLSTCESLPRHIAEGIDCFLRSNDVPEELAATAGARVFYVNTVYARDFGDDDFSVYARTTDPECKFKVPYSAGRYAGDIVFRIEAESEGDAIAEAMRARRELDGDRIAGRR